MLYEDVGTPLIGRLAEEGKIPPHQFTVDGVTYEWLEGAYYKHVSDIKAGKSFGELALLKDDVRRATIKCDEDQVHFATLDQANF